MKSSIEFDELQKFKQQARVSWVGILTEISSAAASKWKAAATAAIAEEKCHVY
jgi:hypothetical protein